MKNIPAIHTGLGTGLMAFWFWMPPGLAQPALELQPSTNRVGKYEKIEFRLELPSTYRNPFDPEEVAVDLHLTLEDGRRLTLPAFHGQDYERRRLEQRGRAQDWFYPAGPPRWQARFAPMETGRYEAVATVRDRSGTVSSRPVRFECVPSTRSGFVRVSRRDSRFFELSEGQPFFAIGQNLAFIGSGQQMTLRRAEETFGKLAANGANYLRIWTCCQDWALAIEARKSAWGRSWSWKPPFVPEPDGPGAGSGRQCVQIPANSPLLNVSPSHPLALRPGTRYVLTGRVRTEAGGGLRLEAPRSRPDQLLASTPALAWTNFRHEFETGPADYWLSGLSFRLEGGSTAWLNNLSLREAAGGPELLWEAEVNRPSRGFYNPVDCFMLDEVVAAAERHGLYLQLCLITRDLYMNALKDPASAEYDQAIADARKLLRYAVARWGYSTSVAGWEYWNEMNPGLPTDRFYTALGEYLEQADPYRHLRSTSTWGPSARDCRHPKLDLADVHFYLRPSDQGRLRDEVDAVLDRARFLREHAPAKPALLGEFGLANEQWQATEEMRRSPELADAHNALWASALSGLSGTALFWWWERLDQHNVYPLYRPLSTFLKDVPWTTGRLQAAAVSPSDPQLQTVGLQSGDRAWLWLFDPRAAWGRLVLEKQTPPEVRDVTLELRALSTGSFRVQWWDTREGRTLREDKAAAAGGSLKLSVPNFRRDIACQVSPSR